MTDDADESDFERLPGLYRAWDLPFLLQDGADYRLDACASTLDGIPLYAVFCRAPSGAEPVTGPSA